jgi:hypothetical protein
MALGRQDKTRVLTTALPFYRTSVRRTGVRVNRLIEQVFESHNGISIELVFVFGSAAADAPIRNFFVEPGHTPHTQKFSQNLKKNFFLTESPFYDIIKIAYFFSVAYALPH